MPKYTALVDIKRGMIIQEPVMFENIHAKNQRQANNKACKFASEYVNNLKGDPDGPDGWKMVMCCRTSLLDKKKYPPALVGINTKNLLPPPDDKKGMKPPEIKFDTYYLKAEI